MVEGGGRPRLSKEERQRQAQKRNRWAREAKRRGADERKQVTEIPLSQATFQTERPKIIYLSQPETVAKNILNETQAAHSQETPIKPPRIPERTIAFIQLSYAAGADEELDERRRILLAHASH
jgi:hypothetical protein